MQQLQNLLKNTLELILYEHCRRRIQRISILDSSMHLMVKKIPNCLKLANFTSVFKKGAHTSKNHYRPSSMLPIFSKTSDKLLQKPLSVFFHNILSKFQCGFQKAHGTQSCVLMMLEFLERCH